MEYENEKNILIKIGERYESRNVEMTPEEEAEFERQIMVRAFRIRIKNGEDFENIAADYPALTADDFEAIKEELSKE